MYHQIPRVKAVLPIFHAFKWRKGFSALESHWMEEKR
jgi:hypothetical protein